MAAHPFGPIEKSLIVAFKELRTDPTRAKIHFRFHKRVKVPNFTDNFIWALCEPIFALEPTANVNSSDYEVNFVPDRFPRQISYSLDTSLIRRGLGYRITFTMPADKEFSLEVLNNSQNQKLEILDVFGRTVLYSDSECEDHLVKQGFPQSEVTVEFQFTCLGVKITKNKVVQVD